MSNDYFSQTNKKIDNELRQVHNFSEKPLLRRRIQNMTIPIAQQYFIDPIGGKLLADPVLNHCDHFYSRAPLNQWKVLTKQDQCPFCKAPFQGLLDDALLQQASVLVSTPPHREYTRVDQFIGENREIVELAIAHITQRRERDQAEQIPSKLDPYLGSNILDQATKFSREVCYKLGCK